MFMPSYTPSPPPPAQQASRQAELVELVRQFHDLEARELQVERRTGAPNLIAVGDARVRAAAL